MRIFKTIDIREFENEKLLNDAIINASEFRKKKFYEMNNHIGKLQIIANTYILDECLKEVGLKEKEMKYEIEEHGKLRFTNVDNIHFNLSHSKNMSLAVISDKPVGCDIQFIDRIDKKVFGLVLSDKEKEEMESIKDSKLQNELFYKLWAMKEAFAKKDGRGLSMNFKEIQDDSIWTEFIFLKTDKELEKYVIAIC